ncbi:cilia- and flagella-associated protein HOATZ isoform X1 [Brienomyrus brachyistius]|uniref:cilia- and flagella-associated protein HOATZ isoform X1 n=1 Tax=Brienomyrus brachyistius TaxID=42636 RepID=UPI0020B225A5|nr:cilia- and flagella-associated protein HOATZ isoform X1 [Brienomyrus brachyistius]
MSEQLDADDFDELDAFFTVFAGSSIEDVTYAKVFWSSVTLQPPLESRLVSASISQRLKVAGDPQPSLEQSTPNKAEEEDLLETAHRRQRAAEKQKYLEMAKKRQDIMALLKKQREDRIKKEMVSRPYKPRKRDKPERSDSRSPPEQSRQDAEEVRRLI